MPHATATHRIHRTALLLCCGLMLSTTPACDSGGGDGADAGGSGGQDGQGTPDAGAGQFGDVCETGPDCASGLCLPVAGNLSVCTVTCDAEMPESACPDSRSWACEGREDEPVVCRCQADSFLEVCADGLDNDCNGATDDCQECGTQLVPPNDPQHCGDCGRRCVLGGECDDGTCVCPDGTHGEGCVAQPGDAECEFDNQCDDGIDCTEDLCNARGHCLHNVVPARCAPGEVCNLLNGGCQPGRACAHSNDCLDQDACTSGETCDPATKVCMWVPLDGDRDGQPPRVCGGGDCNDDQAWTFLGAVEICDGVDNNCDGTVDAPLPADACALDRVCLGGSCQCKPGLTECGGVCVDLNSSDFDCGRCGNACVPGASCSAGQCECADGETECARGCFDLQVTADNCGACGHSCTTREDCLAGSCIDRDDCAGIDCGANGSCRENSNVFRPFFTCDCDPGYAFDGVDTCVLDNACEAGLEADRAWCGGSCRALLTDVNHCGGCDNACGDNGECAGGGCACTEASGMDYCDGAGCVDFTSDEQHCGGCDSACDGMCRAGSCRMASTVVSGYDHSCALMDDGTVYCWGTRTDGSVGDPVLTGGRILPRLVTELESAGAVLQLAAGRGHNCAVVTGDNLYCWGDNATYQAGGPADAAAPKVVRGSVRMAALGAGHTCVVLTSGAIECLGDDSSGQHGDGVQAASPLSVWSGPQNLSDPEAMVAGDDHTCALKDGKVYCWGNNLSGQLGLGHNDIAYSPIEVPGLTGVVEIAAGDDHTCARRDNGTVACWGEGLSRQLGRNATGDSNVPLEVTLPGAAAALHAGGSNSCIQLADQTLYCWGEGSSYQLGNRATADHYAPVLIPGGSYDGVGIGGRHVCALAGGRVSCWGYSYAAGYSGSDYRREPTPLTFP